MASTAVNPPAAAARVPVSTVSLCSKPGSRRWVCRSTRPGSAMSPSASMTRRSGSGRGPTPARRSRRRRSAGRCACHRGASRPRSDRSRSSSTRLPDLHRRAAGRAPPSVSTPRSRPVRSTVERGESAAAAEISRPAVHRAGVHDHGIRAETGEPLVVEAPLARVLARVREEGGVHPLALDAQHHDDVGLGVDGRVEVVADCARASRSTSTRQQGRRGDQVHARRRASPAARRSTGRPASAGCRRRSSRVTPSRSRAARRRRRAGAGASCTRRAAPASGARACRRPR